MTAQDAKSLYTGQCWLFRAMIFMLPLGSVLGPPPAALAQRPLGIDVSGWVPLSASEWVSVYNSGRTFGYTRATYGLGPPDVEFVNHMTRGHAAGVYMGAYHFSYPGLTAGNTPTNEANNFLNVAGSYLTNGYLRPVLDVEYSPGAYMNGLTLSQWCRQWCDHVYAQTGIRPLIYTNQSFGAGLDASLKSAYNLWVAAWWSNPNVQTDNPATFGWSTWTAWQYAGDVPMPGVLPLTKDVDLNVYNGTFAHMQANLVIGPSPTIDRSPSSLSVTLRPSQSTTRTFTVRTSTSGTTLNYTISDDAAWLSENPTTGTAGTSTVTITVTFDTAGLNLGTYNATIQISDPFATNSPQTIPVTFIVQPIPGDFDNDGHINDSDVYLFVGCMTGEDIPQLNPNCQREDLDHDTDVDQSDFGILQRCFNGPLPADPTCAG